MTAILVIDTSYLLELFKVPGCSEPRAVTEVRRRYAEAVERGAGFVVPLPCLFELGNHIADVRQGQARHRLARELAAKVIAAIEGEGERVLAPSPEGRHFRKLWERFAESFSLQRVGLIDTCIIEEARRLKTHYGNMATVHIWTRDERLKAYEPDPEVDPFVQ